MARSANHARGASLRFKAADIVCTPAITGVGAKPQSYEDRSASAGALSSNRRAADQGNPTVHVEVLSGQSLARAKPSHFLR